MPYATQSAFEESFGAAELGQLLADRAGGFAQVAIDADGEINSYLAVRYALPLSYTPARVIAVALDIARYRLFDDAGDTESVWVRRYRDALAWLRDVAAGKAVLTDADGNVLAPPDEANAPAAPYAVPRTLRYGTAFDARYDSQLEPSL